MEGHYPLEKLLNPKSIAIIGAGDNPLRINGRTLMFMLRHRSGAKLLPVNPNRDEVQGIPCYRRIQDLPETPDVGMVMWILLGATLFSNLYRAMGAQDLAWEWWWISLE